MDKLLKKKYPFLSNYIIEDCFLSHSKFKKDAKRHFVARLGHDRKFFIKAFDVSDKNRLISEVKSRKLFSGLYLNIPKIYSTKDGLFYVKINNMYYVVMDFVGKKQPLFYLEDLLKLQSKMHKKINTKLTNSFSLRENNILFVKKYKYITSLINKKNKINKTHKSYLLFCRLEYFRLKSEMSKLKLFKRKIHGDFFNINLIESSRKIWIIDWEKMTESTISNDVCRTIIFELFMNKSLSKKNIEKYVKFYFTLNHIKISKDEIENFIKTFYFLWVTNLSFISRLYEDNVPLRSKMIDEDFKILRFIKKSFIQ